MIGVAFTVAGFISWRLRDDFATTFLFIGILNLLLTGILIVAFIEKMKKEILVVTDKNVIIEKGILAYYYTRIPLTLISGITVNAGIFERLFKTGYIRIEMRWTQDISVVEYIKNPQLIQETIFKCKNGEVPDKPIFL